MIIRPLTRYWTLLIICASDWVIDWLPVCAIQLHYSIYLPCADSVLFIGTYLNSYLEALLGLQPLLLVKFTDTCWLSRASALASLVPSINDWLWLVFNLNFMTSCAILFVHLRWSCYWFIWCLLLIYPFFFLFCVCAVVCAVLWVRIILET